MGGCELPLRFPWLWKHNLTIEWHHNVWRHEQEPTVDEITLDVFKDTLRPKELAFVVFVQEDSMALEPDLKMLAIRIHEILDTYTEFKNVFSDKLTQVVPKNSLWNHVIETQETKIFYRPINLLSKR